MRVSGICGDHNNYCPLELERRRESKSVCLELKIDECLELKVDECVWSCMSDT